MASKSPYTEGKKDPLLRGQNDAKVVSKSPYTEVKPPLGRSKSCPGDPKSRSNVTPGVQIVSKSPYTEGKIDCWGRNRLLGAKSTQNETQILYETRAKSTFLIEIDFWEQNPLKMRPNSYMKHALNWVKIWPKIDLGGQNRPKTNPNPPIQRAKSTQNQPKSPYTEAKSTVGGSKSTFGGKKTWKNTKKRCLVAVLFHYLGHSEGEKNSKKSILGFSSPIFQKTRNLAKTLGPPPGIGNPSGIRNTKLSWPAKIGGGVQGG